MLDFNKFVEGHLTGVTVSQTEKRVVLLLQDSTGKNWALTATDVSEFMILQMSMQNIIDRISVWDASSSDIEYRRKIFSLMYGKFAEEKDDLNLPLINRVIETIRCGDAILVELEPVYGALVLMLARELFLFEK